LTWSIGCGSGATAPHAAPVEPSPSHAVVQTIPIDAPPADAPALPKLACDETTAVTAAPAPEPTWFCARPDGVRHGPFISLFPDLTVEIEGRYANGKLDGAWQRHYPGGAIAETGTYAAGQKTGHWKQLSPAGALLGEYDMKAGSGTEKRWFDDGPLYRERPLRAGALNGTLKVFDHDGIQVIAAEYQYGRLHGSHLVGAKNTMRIEETFKNGVRIGQRQIWQFWQLAQDENYDAKGKLDGAFTIWRDKKVPRVQGTYEHGKRIGTWTWFDRGNNKEREGDYAEGKKTGAWFEWFENKLVFSGSYTDGKPDGEFIYLDRAGNELGRFDIKDGTGVMQTFYPNHKPATKTQFYQGAMEGKYLELTQRAGKVTVEGHYSADRKSGSWKEWTELEVPVLEERFRRGRLDGPVKKYVDGAVVMQATYKDGKAEGPYAELRDGKPVVSGQFTADRKTGTWTQLAADGTVVLTATYKDGVLDGPWHQLVDGVVVEGTLTAGRRTGTWTTTDKAGKVSTVTYKTP